MRSFGPLSRARWGALAAAGLMLSQQADAAPLRVTTAAREVKVQMGAADARRLTINEQVPSGATVSTGANSRTELAFTDAAAVVRLGANTQVRTEQRHLQLDGGALLYQASRGRGAPKITIGGIHLATSGSTGIVERQANDYLKVLVLEGTTRVYVDRAGESILVRAGQLLLTRPGARTLPEPAHFDLAQLYRTSIFTASGFPPLASAGAIERAIAKQKADPDFTRTNLVIFGRGTLVNLVEPTPSPAVSASRDPEPVAVQKAR